MLNENFSQNIYDYIYMSFCFYFLLPARFRCKENRLHIGRVFTSIFEILAYILGFLFCSVLFNSGELIIDISWLLKIRKAGVQCVMFKNYIFNYFMFSFFYFSMKFFMFQGVSRGEHNSFLKPPFSIDKDSIIFLTFFFFNLML